jgi:hypothetical protein
LKNRLSLIYSNSKYLFLKLILNKHEYAIYYFNVYIDIIKGRNEMVNTICAKLNTTIEKGCRMCKNDDDEWNRNVICKKKSNNSILLNIHNIHKIDKENIYNGSGKIPGYAIINLDTRFNIGNGWQVFAKAINIFDKEYVTAGRLAVNSITNSGIFDARTDLDEQQGGAFVAPGAPRAGWIGVRYEFGGADKK